jgi:hypothetical protein
MSNNRFINFIIPFLLFSPAASANIISLEKDHTDLLISQLNDLSLDVNMSVGDIEWESVSIDGGEYIQIQIPGYHKSHEVGEPELPQIHRLIEIPYGALPRVEITSQSIKEIPLSDLGVTSQIVPVQPSIPKSSDPAEAIFTINDDIYSQNQYLPRSLISIDDEGILRGVRIANIIIRPIEYNPVTGSLRIHTDLEFIVHFDNADLSLTNDEKNKYYSPVFEPVYSLLANYEAPDLRNDLVLDPVTYLIIANTIFEDQLSEFIDWKTEKGYEVLTGYTDEIGSSNNAIKSYIQDLYENPAEGISPPSFVLFVGDVAQLPTWNGNTGSHVTDLKYCEFTSDYLPEIYYGRFSASNASQLQAQIDKTLEYDQYAMPDPSYLGDVVMIAGMDASHGSTWGNGQINYGTTYYFNEDHGIFSNTYLFPNSGSNSGNIINNVSDGVGYVNYTAHGGETNWVDPSFNINNINSLENAHKYPLVVGNCCLTNSFDYGTCFGEAWLRAEEKGAIGYIGASNNTYWDEDYWWGVGAGSINSNPTYEGTGPGAYDGIFHDHGETESEWYITNDAIIMAGNLAVVEAGGSTNYYWEIYHLMGDPSLSAYMGIPEENTVSHLPILQIGLESFSVTADPYSYVGLSMDGVLHGAGLVGPEGLIELDILPFSTGGTASVVVSGQNKVPYMGSVEVGNADGPYIIVDDLLVENDSNGNGQIDYGETIEAILCAENVGQEIAYEVTANVTSDDPYVTMINNNVSFGDIDPGTVLLSIENISFDISNQTPDGHAAFFDVTFTSTDDIWQGNFNITINAYCVIGDVNADWDINVLDVISTVNIILNADDDPTELEECSADTNEDGIINILDVIYMINIIIGT